MELKLNIRQHRNLRGGKTLDTSVPDIYDVNKDQFNGTTTEKICDNGDLTTSISGLYASCGRGYGTISESYMNFF
jgi:hypothetical protein